VIGDRKGDVELAWTAGARGVLVKTGYGLGEATYGVPSWERPPEMIAEHLLEAVQRIVTETRDARA
jgi:D-glycero-D-manno-heptose 1,7-bisphosphate phosphatase